MNEPSEPAEQQELRRLVLGLGTGSSRKSHYPGLRQRVMELERFRSMVDLSGDLLFVLDARNGTIIDLNRTACECLGAVRERLVGSRFDALLQPERRVRFSALLTDFDQCLKGPLTIEAELPGPADSVFPVEMTVRCGNSGDQSYAVLAARDITERRKADADLRQIAAVYASTHEGVVITATDGTIVNVNPAFSEITGYGEAEVLGRNPRLLKSDRHDRDFYQTMWRDLTAAGRWQGEIWNRRRNGEVYPELLAISAVRNAAGTVTHYVGVFTDISQVKTSEMELDFLAHHDALTGLPNRLLLGSRLEHAVGRSLQLGTSGALLFIDLDRFKDVNDSLGHGLGDELLKVVAQRLSERVQESDTLARLGGDEFAVVLEEIRGPAEAVDMARDLLARVERPITISGGRELYITASIGISLFPEDGASAPELIQHADSALYQAKGAGRNVYRFYTAALTRAANQRLELEAALRRALESGEFLLHYQPLISLADGEVLGVESLLRWQTQEGELVLPGRFIPLAEETGLIVPLGEWVLQEACRSMKRWLDAGVNLNTLAVNLSALQFRQQAIDARVRNALDTSGLREDRLELELTESTIMGDVEENYTTLAALKDVGVRIAVDDFGTGYSSLAYLKRFPIDKLKIDMSFVRDIPQDPTDMAIVETIIAMARSLRLEVLAEGVETGDQFDFLRRHGCDTGQGYLFSRPLPESALITLLKGRSGLNPA